MAEGALPADEPMSITYQHEIDGIRQEAKDLKTLVRSLVEDVKELKAQMVGEIPSGSAVPYTIAWDMT